MSEGLRFSTIVAPVDFAEVGEDEHPPGGLVVDADSHHVAFSAATRQAVDHAASLARLAGPKGLHLLHTIPPMQSSTMYTGPVAVPQKIIDEIHDKARAVSLKAMEALVRAVCPDLDVELAVAPGHPMQFVLDYSEKVGADLIVMAASGRSRVARFFVGSTADRIIREARCPVLVVPAPRE